MTSPHPRHALVVRAAAATAGVLVLAGCGAAAGTASGSASSPDGSAHDIAIVASTNVYGDIARQIAGDEATVTSLITSPSQDPHEYEASARDRLAVTRADVVIENGGGYDPFLDALLDSTGADPVVLDAVAVSGLVPRLATGDDAADTHPEHAHAEGVNEHVWYDFAAMEALAARLADTLGELDPANAATYDANYTTFADQIAELTRQAADMKSRIGGRGVAITEPVPLYLLEAVGLVNRTPEDFSEAVEEGADVAPRALQETLALFTRHEVTLLAYNSQASDPTTERVRDAAVDAGVPVVDFTETLPDGTSYIAWQQANLDHIAGVIE